MTRAEYLTKELSGIIPDIGNYQINWAEVEDFDTFIDNLDLANYFTPTNFAVAEDFQAINYILERERGLQRSIQIAYDDDIDFEFMTVQLLASYLYDDEKRIHLSNWENDIEKIIELSNCSHEIDEPDAPKEAKEMTRIEFLKSKISQFLPSKICRTNNLDWSKIRTYEDFFNHVYQSGGFDLENEFTDDALALDYLKQHDVSLQDALLQAIEDDIALPEIDSCVLANCLGRKLNYFWYEDKVKSDVLAIFESDEYKAFIIAEKMEIYDDIQALKRAEYLESISN